MDGNIYRMLLPYGTKETERQIKQLIEDYGYVKQQHYQLTSVHHGQFDITVVWYASPRKAEGDFE